MFTDIEKEKLTTLLKRKELDDFFNSLDALNSSEEPEQAVLDIREEWRKLQIAQRNGLMDEEQVHLALTAYFRKKCASMSEVNTEK